MNAYLRKAFSALCELESLPEPVFEYQIEALRPRRWRYDICFPDQKVIVEVEGGAWTRGRHTRGKGFLSDIEKYNAAVVLGYRLLRYAPDSVLTDKAMEEIKNLLSLTGGDDYG